MQGCAQGVHFGRVVHQHFDLVRRTLAVKEDLGFFEGQVGAGLVDIVAADLKDIGDLVVIDPRHRCAKSGLHAVWGNDGD